LSTRAPPGPDSEDGLPSPSSQSLEVNSDEAAQVNLVEQTTAADVTLSDGVESAIDGLAVSVVQAAQTQTDADAPATAAAVAASASAQATAIGADAYAQAAYTAQAARAAATMNIGDAQGNALYDEESTAAQIVYTTFQQQFDLDAMVYGVGVSPGFSLGPLTVADLGTAGQTEGAAIKQAGIDRATTIGSQEVAAAGILGIAEQTLAAAEGQIEITLTQALGTAADGLAATLAGDDEQFVQSVSQGASGTAQSLAGDDQTWTDTVDPEQVSFITTQGTDEVTSARSIAAAQTLYALATAATSVGNALRGVPGVGTGSGSAASAFQSAYTSAYTDWLQKLTPTFIADAATIAQDDASNQDALATAAENADEAGAAANVAFVAADAPAAATEAVSLETAGDGYGVSVVKNLDAGANSLASADAVWMNALATTDANYLTAAAAADAHAQLVWAEGGAMPPWTSPQQAAALKQLTDGRADADLALVTSQASIGQQFASSDATNWQTMIGGEASAIDTFSDTDDAAVAADNDAAAQATGNLITATTSVGNALSGVPSVASAMDDFSIAEANQTTTEWQSLVGWALPTSNNPSGQAGQPWLQFESQKAGLLAQWQQTASSDDQQYVSTLGQDEVAYSNADAAAFVTEANTIDAADKQAADTAADSDQTLVNSLATDEVAYEDSAATATSAYQVTMAQAFHDDTYAVAQATYDMWTGASTTAYYAELATAAANFTTASTAAGNVFQSASGVAESVRIRADAAAALLDSQQIADAVLTDSLSGDKAIDVYSRAESDAYDQQQKSDAQAFDTQETSDANAYSSLLSQISQSTPWGIQAASQAQALAAQADALAQALLTLTDNSADAQDLQEDTQWDAQQTQADTLAQLAHTQAYADAQAIDDQAVASANSTSALAAIDAFFTALPGAPDDGLEFTGWGEGQISASAAPAFFSNYSSVDQVDDVSTGSVGNGVPSGSSGVPSGGQGWSHSAYGTQAPFSTMIGPLLSFSYIPWFTPYNPPNPVKSEPGPWNDNQGQYGAGGGTGPYVLPAGDLPAAIPSLDSPIQQFTGDSDLARATGVPEKPATAREPTGTPEGNGQGATLPTGSVGGSSRLPPLWGDSGLRRRPSAAEILYGPQEAQPAESYQRLGGPPREPMPADEMLQNTLDIFGLQPGIGEVADVASAGVSAYGGDWKGFFLSIGAAVPILGHAAGTAKIARRAAKIADKVDDISDATRAVDTATDTAKQLESGARAASDVQGKVRFIDDTPHMSEAARDFEDAATGARSNVSTQKRQVPVLERKLPDGSVADVKFDGIDGNVLIDRKRAITTFEKSKEQAIRQSDALRQNGLTGRWEVLNEREAARARKMLEELHIDNIVVEVSK
jgi:hypothetical protein